MATIRGIANELTRVQAGVEYKRLERVDVEKEDIFLFGDKKIKELKHLFRT
jgi:hypothetical protein